MQLAAQLLNQDGKHDEAEAVLRKVNFETCAAVGGARSPLPLPKRKKLPAGAKEALATYQSIAADEAVQPKQRQAAQDAIKALEK